MNVVDHLETYPKLIQGSKWQWSATVCFGVLQYVSTCLTFFPMLQSAQLLKSIGHFMGVMENQVEIIGNPEKINEHLMKAIENPMNPTDLNYPKES